jgi:hypothetical protein
MQNKKYAQVHGEELVCVEILTMVDVMARKGHLINNQGEYDYSCIEPGDRHANYANKRYFFKSSLTEAPNVLSEDISYIMQIHYNGSRKCHVCEIGKSVQEHGY